MKCSIFREIDSLKRLEGGVVNLNCSVVQGLDLREAGIEWERLECEGAIFLGCQFPPDLSICDLQEMGALIFPNFGDLPFNP